jgi:MFS family permease
VDRSLLAVLLGTFMLRFSSGLTGAMLGAYLAALPEYGGERVNPIVVGALAATFYVAELVLSPLFGILSDRQGHHRVMLYGPIFGAVAVVLTAFTADLGLSGPLGLLVAPLVGSLAVLGITRWLEGASTAASVPSILGYIAVVTAGSAARRGKASARFEGATLLGIGAGFALAPVLFAAVGPIGFLLNAVLYGVAFLIFWTVRDPAGDADAATAPHVGPGRYLALLRSAHVWLLAPTWIAVNASIGLWFSQSIFQLTTANPEFPDQSLMRGFDPIQISVSAVIVGIIFGAGLVFWGDRFKTMRRTTIILYGILGGGALVAAGLVVNHAGGAAVIVLLAAGIVAAAGLFVLAGATPAALGLLADISERFPHDRGAIMGLYSVFLALGQIIGALIGGLAADLRGIDGMLIATAILLAVALIPLARLRQDEDMLTAPGDAEGAAA